MLNCEDMIENSDKSACIATVGFFDGVHAGHRYLIDELKTLAQSKGLRSVVITFSKHPRKVLNSEYQPQLLTSLPEKTAQLNSTGIDECVVLDFNLELAQLSAYDFLETVLKEQFHVTTLLVGHDHRFGHNRNEGFDEYKKYGDMLGIEVIQAQRYNTPENQHISSSEIRLALDRGNIEQANTLLTYPYSFEGRVTNGFKIGRKIGFPTANLVPLDADKLMPPFGVYAVRVFWNGSIYAAMMNIGTRPTLDNSYHVTNEVHILDFNQDIYNQTIKVEFLHKIRDEKKFNGIDELIAQLSNDRETVIKMNLNTENLNN